MARKKLNKNLVAFLTGAGVFLSVLVVGVLAYNQSQRDPEELAQKAIQREKAGDPRRAISLLKRAFAVNNEAKYLIDAAAIAYRIGEIADTLRLLQEAHAQTPDDPAILHKLLDQFWEFRPYPLGQWDEVDAYADALLEIEPESPLALASKIDALRRLHPDTVQPPKIPDIIAPEFREVLDGTIRRARQADVQDPHVAVALADVEVSVGMHDANEMLKKRRSREEAEKTMGEARQRAMDLLAPALKRSPDETRLRTTLAGLIKDSKDPQRAQALIEEGVKLHSDDADLHFSLAQLHLLQAAKLRDSGSKEDVVAHARAGAENAQQALDLAPALYDAYPLRARLNQIAWEAEGRWPGEGGALEKRILESYLTAFKDTVDLRSVRSQLGEENRALMIVRGFGSAVQYHTDATDPQVKEMMLGYARKMLDEAVARYPDSWIVPMMRGQIASIEHDLVVAIQRYTETDAKIGLARSRFSLEVKEQLARLYRQSGDYGLAMQFTDQAIELCGSLGIEPAEWLWVSKAFLLNATSTPDNNRAQQALDLIDSLATRLPNSRGLTNERVRSLAMLNRSDESIAALKNLGDESSQMYQARIHIARHDYAAAEQVLREVVTANPKNVAALRMLVQAMALGAHKPAAVELIDGLLASAQDADYRLALEALKVSLTTADADARDAKLLELVNSVKDDAEREGGLVNYWLTRASAMPKKEGETPEAYAERVQAAYHEADQHLAALDKIEGEDGGRLRMRFELALQQGEPERAETLIPRLTELNVDRAGGAVLRGQLAMVRNKPDDALLEFRDAERKLSTDPQIKVMVAQALVRMPEPRYEEAIETLKQAVEIDPRNFAANRILYSCYEALGQRRSGIKYLKRAQQLNPNDEFVKQRSLLLAEADDPNYGIEQREKLREDQPWQVDNLVRLADLYARVDKDDKAIEALDAAIKEEPDNQAVAAFAAEFYAKRKNRAAGEAALRKYIDARKVLRDGADITAMLLLGRFYDRIAAPDDAQATFDEATRRAEQASNLPPTRRLRLQMACIVDLAEHYGRMKDFDRQVEAYDRVLALVDGGKLEDADRAKQELRIKRLRGLLSGGRLGDFETASQAFRKDYPDDLRGSKLQAEFLLKSNRIDEARTLLSRILRDAAEDHWALYMRARVYLNQATPNYSGARTDLLRLKGLAPDAFELRPRMELARVYELTEQYRLAETELRELIQLDPKRVEFAQALIRMFRGAGELQKAEQFLNEMIARDNTQPYWQYQLGRFLLDRKQYSAAVRPLQRAVELTDRAKNVRALEISVADWILAMTRGERPEEAIMVIERLTKKEPHLISPAVRAYAAEAYVRLNRPRKASEQYRLAMLESSKMSVRAVDAVAAAQIGQVGIADCITLLRDLLKEAKAGSDASMRFRGSLTRVLLQAAAPEQIAEARKLIEENLAAATPDSLIALEAMLMKARAVELTGDAEHAVRIYEDVIERFDKAGRGDRVPAVVLNNVAYILADKLSRQQDALPYAQKAREAAPTDANVLDTLGWVYFQLDRFGEAEPVFREALRNDPENLPARYHLGRVLARTGRPDDARRAYDLAERNARQAENDEYLKLIDEAKRNLQ